MVVGALLGPERTGDRFFSSRVHLFSYRPEFSGVWRGCVVGVWLLVENCTVDASIFY